MAARVMSDALGDQLEDMIDEAGWESFPASDPPAVTPPRDPISHASLPESEDIAAFTHRRTSCLPPPPRPYQSKVQERFEQLHQAIAMEVGCDCDTGGV